MMLHNADLVYAVIAVSSMICIIFDKFMKDFCLLVIPEPGEYLNAIGAGKKEIT